MVTVTAALRMAAHRFNELVTVILPEPDKRAGQIALASGPTLDVVRREVEGGSS